MRVSDVRVSNRAVLDHVVSHHGFEVSIRITTNHFLGVVIKFGCGDIFLGETFKNLLGDFYEGHVLWFYGVNAW